MIVRIYTNSTIRDISWLLAKLLVFLFLYRNRFEKKTLKCAIGLFSFMGSKDYKEISSFSEPELRKNKDYLSNELYILLA